MEERFRKDNGLEQTPLRKFEGWDSRGTRCWIEATPSLWNLARKE